MEFKTAKEAEETYNQGYWIKLYETNPEVRVMIDTVHAVIVHTIADFCDNQNRIKDFTKMSRELKIVLMGISYLKTNRLEFETRK